MTDLPDALVDLDKVEWSLNRHILEALSQPRPGDSKPPTQWPSSGSAVVVEDGKERVLGKCRRENLFRLLIDEDKFHPEKYSTLKDLIKHLKDHEIPVRPEMRFIWAQGELYEDYVIKQAKKTGVFVHEQVQVYAHDWRLSGRIDIVVIDPTTGKLSIIEVKSVYGFGADVVMGKKNSISDVPGKPRDSNLIQTALYDWWVASQNREQYGPSRLQYGARDTGRFAEYLVQTLKNEETDEVEIWYAQIEPRKLAWVKSPITITSVLAQYDYTEEYLRKQEVPPRDFDLAYSKEKIHESYEAGRLNKTQTKQYEKVLAREAENAEREAQGLKAKVDINLPHVGDFQCGYCKFRNTCYDTKGTPREL